MAGPIVCTFPDCKQTFTNEKEMKLHKKLDDNHDYCKRCDYDAADWHDLLAHKVDAMAPYIIGDKRFDRVKEPKHIVCEFCGEEFKSFRGRELHRNKSHQADQNIVCKAQGPVHDEVSGRWLTSRCDAVFLRPSALIHHYESGACPFIHPVTFQDCRQQKHIFKQLMEDQESFFTLLNQSKFVSDMTTSDIDEDETDASEGGARLDFGPHDANIDILSVQDDEQTQGPTALVAKPALSVIDMNAPMTRPADFGQATTMTSASGGLANAMTAMSLKPRGDQTGEHVADADQSSDTHYQMLPWTRPVNLGDYLAHNGDQEAIAAAAELTRMQDGDKNIFYSRFWQPGHRHFHEDMYWNVVTEQYACPFPRCDDKINSIEHVKRHLRTSHLLDDKPRCPACFKTFRSVSSLVSHFETSESGITRCVVAKMADYPKILHQVTGGFLGGSHVNDVEVFGIKAKYFKVNGQKVLRLVKVEHTPRTENDRGEETGVLNVDLNTRGPGVMKFKYKGEIPTDAEGPSKHFY